MITAQKYRRKNSQFFFGSLISCAMYVSLSAAAHEIPGQIK